MIKTLSVTLKECNYPIFIGNDLFTRLNTLNISLPQHLCIVTNETVGALYLKTIVTSLQAMGHHVDHFMIQEGEQYKNQTSWYNLLTYLLEQNHTRKSILIALGGGVIGDLTGFAAATYQRGIPFIQIPTTLLAQVDASVGGKTAINHPLGKNMIGAFYQPQAVIIDVQTLVSLPQRELSAGLAEVIKYGIILDEDFFCWLERHMDGLIDRQPDLLKDCIARCCRLKADIVKQDTKELSIRAILNLGHTYGHAIETELGFGQWLHGEAVAVGMVMACRTAQLLGELKEQDCQRVITLLERAGLPTKRPKEMSVDAYYPHMQLDKKTTEQGITLIIPHRIGHAAAITSVDRTLIQQSILMS